MIPALGRASFIPTFQDGSTYETDWQPGKRDLEHGVGWQRVVPPCIALDWWEIRLDMLRECRPRTSQGHRWRVFKRARVHISSQLVLRLVYTRTPHLFRRKTLWYVPQHAAAIDLEADVHVHASWWYAMNGTFAAYYSREVVSLPHATPLGKRTNQSSRTGERDDA